MAAASAANAPIWEHVIDIHAVLSPTPVTEPTAAGRPDVIVIDRTLNSLRTGQWRHWEDTSRFFREIGLHLPRLRRVLVPRGSALAHDIRTGLAHQRKKLVAGLTLAHPFYDGANKDDVHAVCSLIRLGLTLAHSTRQLAHHMAQLAIEPAPRAGANGISLVDRLSLLRDLFETRWQIGTGANAKLMGPAYAPGTYLTQQNESGQTPLEIAILAGNTAMEAALRQLTEQPQRGLSDPALIFPELPASLLGSDEWHALETEHQAYLLLSSPPPPADIEALWAEPFALTNHFEHTSRHGTPTIAADPIDSFTRTTDHPRARAMEYRSSSDTLFVESQLARNTPSESPPQTGAMTESPHKRRRAAANPDPDAHHHLPAGDA